MTAEVSEKRAYTYAEAAEVTGVSVRVLQRHVQLGYLSVRYPSSKPVIRTEDLNEWLDQLPQIAP